MESLDFVAACKQALVEKFLLLINSSLLVEIQTCDWSSFIQSTLVLQELLNLFQLFIDLGMLQRSQLFEIYVNQLPLFGLSNNIPDSFVNFHVRIFELSF